MFLRKAGISVAIVLALLAASLSAYVVAAGAPPEVFQYAKDWPLPNKDYANTRSTSDAAINSQNVATLGVAWAFAFPPSGAFGSASSNPIIMGDTVYFQDLAHNVYAVDLGTGTVKWSRIYGISGVGPNGPAVGWGKLFASSGPYTMAALDLATGAPLWEQAVSGIDKGTVGIDIQPTVYDHLVLLSTVPGSSNANFYAGGGIGVLYGLDESSGAIRWSFSTVDSADVWGNPDVNSGGGSWYPPAVDESTGVLFWSVANPALFPGTAAFPNGSSRPGPNLYTNSLVALGDRDGRVKWYTQVLPHDIMDHDLELSPILTTATIGGRSQEIVISGGKMGRVYAFNRETGALLWVAVVGDHENDQLAAFPSGSTTTVLPGILGGVETPMAYADGVVFVAVNNLATDFTPSTWRLHSFGESTGDLVAIEVATGQILWQKHFLSGNYGGATVVNDLVFTGTFDGMIYAFQKDTGAELWSYQGPAGVNAWPAVAGDTIVWPVAGPGLPSLIAFRLGSTAPKLQIVTPQDGSAVSVGNLSVQAEVLNLRLAAPGKALVAGEGHVFFSLDSEPPTVAGTAVAVSGQSVVSTDGRATFANVTPGAHTVWAELVNDDGTPLVPAVVVKSTIVADANPRILITSPANGDILKSGSLKVSVSVVNLNLVASSGQIAAPGEGEIRYSLDGGAPEVTAVTTHTWANVEPGVHVITAELVSGSGLSLAPVVVAKITVYVVKYTGGVGSQ